MKSLILLKIGGGVITDKTERYAVREEVLTRLAVEIGEAQRDLGKTKLIIGNGAGSFAHYSAHEYRTASGFVDEKSRIGMGWVRYDAVKLNQIVFEQLLSANVPVFTFSPSSFLSVVGGVTKQVFLSPMTELLNNKMIPLVYGDVVVDSEKGCGIYSTEKVFDDLAKHYAKDYEVRVIHVSAEQGVYKKGQASIYPEITRQNFEDVKAHLGGSNGVDVSGGMLHKVEECIRLAELGVKSLIVSGMVEGRVRDAILGRAVKGTLIG